MSACSRRLEPSTRVFRDSAKVLVISTPFGETGKFYELFCAAEDGLLPSARAVQAPVWEMDTSSMRRGWTRARGAGRGRVPAGAWRGVRRRGRQFFDLRGVEFEDGPARPEDGATGLPGWIRRSMGIGSVWRWSASRSTEPGVLVVGRVDAIEPGERLRSLERRGA